jgi:hypothetical protein
VTRQESVLVSLVKLVEHIPMPPPPAKRGQGRPKFVRAACFGGAVIAIVRHLHRVHELLAVWAEPTAEMTQWRVLLMEVERCPSRRT